MVFPSSNMAANARLAACATKLSAVFTPRVDPNGVARATRVASIYIGGARLPAIGPLVAKMENEPALGLVLRGGLVDGSKLPDHYLALNLIIDDLLEDQGRPK
jgi:hypothetical protein